LKVHRDPKLIENNETGDVSPLMGNLYKPVLFHLHVQKVKGSLLSSMHGSSCTIYIILLYNINNIYESNGDFCNADSGILYSLIILPKRSSYLFQNVNVSCE